MTGVQTCALPICYRHPGSQPSGKVCRTQQRLCQPEAPLGAPILFGDAEFPRLLAGIAQPDDAAVYQLDEERAVIATADFFPPVVDDAYDFGAVAAANALSDIYAMGGDPLFALNLLCWPGDQSGGLLAEILRGGAEKVREAGAVLAGGHSVADQEPKFGLAVIGLAHPKKIWTKGGAQPGDELVLTKPLGSGTITTALKNGAASAAHVAACVAVMAQLTRGAMLAGRSLRIVIVCPRCRSVAVGS